ncbi:MAG: SGNH/GDSL hydrolase family protein [Phocaeicola sp.]
MKKLLLFFMLTAASCITAQERSYSTYWHQRTTLFEKLPITSKDIVFVGNSITDGGEWFELLNNKHVKNRGISGDVSMGVYDRLEAITNGKPKKIFILIGVNDLPRKTAIEEIVSNINQVIGKIKEQSPKTKIYLQSVLPMSDEKNMFHGHTERHADVAPLNSLLEAVAQKEQITYIDLYSQFINPETGKMDLRYTNDGLHLLGAGYELWASIVKPYVNN